MLLKKTGFLLLLLFPSAVFSQFSNDSTAHAAGSEYELTPFKQFIKGSNYRKEWARPVMLPEFSLTKATSIRVILNEEKRKVLFAEINSQPFILKTPDRSFPKVINLDIEGTFIGNLMNDKVSAFYPYAESVMSELASGANLFNTDCEYAFLSNNNLPDSLQEDFANKIYAVESIKKQDNISEYISALIDTDSLIEMKLQGAEFAMDENTYLRSRLFDIWVNDWKTEDAQIKWIKNSASTVVSPIVINRDRSFFYYNGTIFKILLGVAHLNFIQPFQEKMDEKKTFEIAAENNDRFFTTSLNKSQWLRIAETLQNDMTDGLIDQSLKNLPAEIYPLSGKNIAQKLKLRRNRIPTIASDYYDYLSREIDIPGSDKNEDFIIRQSSDSTTDVIIRRDGKIVYQNQFNSNITRQLRLYGIGGKNKFEVYTRLENKTQVNIIGGYEPDSVIHSGKGKIKVYDNPENYLELNRSDIKRISNDTAINRFSYRQFSYQTNAFIPSAFYSNEDQIYLSAGYQIRNFKWRNLPFASNHLLELHYSLMDKGLSVTYKGKINDVFQKSNLSLFANYDQIRWTPFFGLGNNSEHKDVPIEYYRTRTTEWNASAILNREFGVHNFSFGPVFQSYKILKDENRFIYKQFSSGDSIYQIKNWAGLQFGYELTMVNDSIVPTKGVLFKALISFNKNFNNNKGDFQKYSFLINGILPITDHISFSTTGGVQTVAGNPYFFQYPFIGGPTLRGYIRNRFWGKTVFYNNNDLRYIANFRSFLFNGKAGFLLFSDNGRVWMNENESGKFHSGYGVGIIAVPFNKILLNATLGFSKDGTAIQFKAIQYF